MKLVSQTDSLSDTFYTPAISQENILDLDNSELHRCLAESTPKMKTKKNPDKKIKNLWEKFDNQEKINVKLIKLTSALQKQFCEITVLQSKTNPPNMKENTEALEHFNTEKTILYQN